MTCELLIKTVNIIAEVLSLNGFERVSVSSNSSARDGNFGEYNVNDLHSSVVVVSRKSNVGIVNANDVDTQSKCDDHSTTEANQPVFLDEISSSVDEASSEEEGILDNCGILPSTCLPCLASTVPSVEKRRSYSSSPPSARKKAALKLPFKWKEHANASLCKRQNHL